MRIVEITVHRDGTTDIDLKEGFAGVGCVETSKKLELIIGGKTVETKEKPEMFEGGDVSVDLGIDLKL